jgi:hypothetical protein
MDDTELHNAIDKALGDSADALMQKFEPELIAACFLRVAAYCAIRLGIPQSEFLGGANGAYVVVFDARERQQQQQQQQQPPKSKR